MCQEFAQARVHLPFSLLLCHNLQVCTLLPLQQQHSTIGSIKYIWYCPPPHRLPVWVAGSLSCGFIDFQRGNYYDSVAPPESIKLCQVFDLHKFISHCKSTDKSLPSAHHTQPMTSLMILSIRITYILKHIPVCV